MSKFDLRGGLSPRAVLRPKRLKRLARNAAAYYILSRPFKRTINPRREAMRRVFEPTRVERVISWLLRDVRRS